MQIRKVLRSLVRNPYLDLGVGVILLVSGLWESGQTIVDDVASGQLHASHGVVILGIVTALRALTDVFAGLEFVDEAEIQRKNTPLILL